MRKKLLSLALALALCLGLAAPVSAAGTKKVVEDETHGVKITMNEFLRVETHRYNRDVWIDEDFPAIDKPVGGTIDLTLYVVADNSTVTVEALPGRKYGDPILKDVNRWDFVMGKPDTNSPEYAAYQAVRENVADYALDTSEWHEWIRAEKFFHNESGPMWPLLEAMTYTVSPSPEKDEYGDLNEIGPALIAGYDAIWICESDYARLAPAKLQASGWAAEEVTRAWDAKLMPFSPYLVDCTRSMTRAQFAAVTVNLYAAMTGKAGYWPDASEDHPFTDVDYETTDYETEIGMAYDLGFVKGSNTAGTLFSPTGTLTRQEAAVMLGRVYAKLHGAVPTVSNTTFADDEDVADWAKSDVAFMSGKEVVKGKGDNRFAPKDALSIQEAVIMANRMLENLK